MGVFRSTPGAPAFAFDHTAFPHLIDLLAQADPGAKRKLSSTCKDLRCRLGSSPYFHVSLDALFPPHAQSFTVGISTADGPVCGLGLRGPGEWSKVHDCTAPGGTTWVDTFAGTLVVDLAAAQRCLHLDAESCTHSGTRRPLKKDDTVHTLIKPKIIRQWATSTFHLGCAQPQSTLVLIADLKRGANMMYRDVWFKTTLVPKLVVAIRYTSPTLEDMLRPASDKYSLRVQMRNFLRAFVYETLFAVKGHYPREYEGPLAVDLVGFQNVPSPSLLNGNENDMVTAETLREDWDEAHRSYSNHKFKAPRKTILNILSVEEYASKYNFPLSVVRLEQGDNFLFGAEPVKHLAPEPASTFTFVTA